MDHDHDHDSSDSTVERLPELGYRRKRSLASSPREGLPNMSEVASETGKVVHGEFIGHSMHLGFVWLYRCESCGGLFKQVTPEVSAPALCHSCYAGTDLRRRMRREVMEKLR